MKVFLSTPVLNDGDAIGNDILGMANALEAEGVEVRFFADQARVARHVEPLHTLPREFTQSDSILIHHQSLRCDAALDAIRSDPTRVIVKYHNVTPARFFVEAHPTLILATELGERQARQAVECGVTLWFDSDFNARELGKGAALSHYAVLPPFHHAESLVELPPDADSIAGLDDWCTTILCVGRVAPNKNLELAIETLAEVRQQLDPNARLVIAGEHMFPKYSQELSAWAERWGVADAVVVTGRVSTAQLKSLYRSADVLLVTSLHEGFCVPLVEAMALEVPIVAVAGSAIPETAGDAALYAETAPELAWAIRRCTELLNDREELLTIARRRYRDRYSPNILKQNFWQLLMEFEEKSSQNSRKKLNRKLVSDRHRILE